MHSIYEVHKCNMFQFWNYWMDVSSVWHWVSPPCRLAEVSPPTGLARALPALSILLLYLTQLLIATVMEAVISSETSVSIYQTTWHNIPEDSHLQKVHCTRNWYMTQNMKGIKFSSLYSKPSLFVYGEFLTDCKGK
jgi:hypothetical protein